MSEFDLKELLAAREGESYELQRKHVNPQFTQVLKYIGFNKEYVRAEGAHLYDKEGNRYLDCLGGYGIFNYARNHPVITKALSDFLAMDMASMVQMDGPLLSGLLAEKLVALTPRNLDTVFFANSGAEVVEGALKYAKAATKRKRIVHITKGFHGLTTGALACNGDPNFKEGFLPLIEGFDEVPFNDLDALEAELKKEDVAGFIVEPVLGKGAILPDDNYLPAAQALCRKYGTKFILDEVQTGLGRTGKMFALEHWNLEPDILLVAKALSGGFVPCGAMITTREIYDAVFNRLDRCVVHSSTFGRGNMAMVAGLAVLHVIESEGIVEHVASMGEKILQRMTPFVEKYEMVKEVRGKGLLFAMEFGSPNSMSLKMGWKMLHKIDAGLFSQIVIMPLMEKYRILAQVPGHNMDAVKFIPPCAFNDEDLDYLIEALDDVLTRSHRFPGSAWTIGSTLTKLAIRS